MGCSDYWDSQVTGQTSCIHLVDCSCTRKYVCSSTINTYTSWRDGKISAKLKRSSIGGVSAEQVSDRVCSNSTLQTPLQTSTSSNYTDGLFRQGPIALE